MIRGNRRGMTASETLLVAVVFAAIALMLAWRFIGEPSQGARRLTIERMNVVIGGLQTYAIDNGGVFPTAEQGLQALTVRPTDNPPIRWRGPYVEGEDLFVDGWGVPLNYVSPGGDGRPYDLWSNGADRAEGGEGENADMQSWNRSTLIP